jgi:hypothetical protein
MNTTPDSSIVIAEYSPTSRELEPSILSTCQAQESLAELYEADAYFNVPGLLS